MNYSIFGESHGPAIGVVLEGVPVGLELDLDAIRFDLSRRAPGKNALSTARREADEPRILSGVFEGRTTGAPLCAIIEDTDSIRQRDLQEVRDGIMQKWEFRVKWYGETEEQAKAMCTREPEADAFGLA